MARAGGRLIEEGVRVSDSLVFRQDKIWSRHSNDKVNIGETLARVIRTLSRYLPLDYELNALSIGSSNEPQFRILQSAFSGSLFLLDIEKEALETVRERVHRQKTRNVCVVQGDFNRVFSGPAKTVEFREKRLLDKRMELVTLQHSLYYCRFEKWPGLVERLYEHIVAPKGALYMVLMSARSDDPRTTTWLYNHFAGKFGGHKNDQCLLTFRKRLDNNAAFRDAEILNKTSHVEFFTEDFKAFMAVVWMILLYPQVHAYTVEQRREITESFYENFFRKKQPLIQSQDHLVIYRGLDGPGLI